MAKKKSKNFPSAKQCGLPLLKSLVKLDANELRTMLSYVDDNCIDNLCEILYNLLYAKLPMTTQRKARIRKIVEHHKNTYHYVTSKKNSVKRRRHHLQQQTGGSLTLLLATALPLLTSLIFGKK